MAKFFATCEGLSATDRQRALEIALQTRNDVGAERSPRIEATLAEAEIAMGRLEEGLLRLRAAIRLLEAHPAEWISRAEVEQRLRELTR